MKSTDPDYITQLERIWRPLFKHIRGEEERELPYLETYLETMLKDGGKESRELAKGFYRTKKFVPTRSHPRVGEHPPFETVLGLLTAPFDRVADAFRKFPK